MGFHDFQIPSSMTSKIALALLCLAGAGHAAISRDSLREFASTLVALNPAAAFTPVSLAALGKSPATLKKAAARAGARAGCQRNTECMMAVGLFFSTSTGNTETVAGAIAEASGLEAVDVDDVSPSDFEGFDGIIAGAPTWHTGADEQRSGTSWDDLLEEITGLDLNGKPVAIFGCGDSAGYSDNFCDAIEEMYSTFKAAGAKMIGSVDASDYEYDDSKSVVDGKFLGLATDEDNESEKTEDRAKAWVEQLKSEGMPI